MKPHIDVIAFNYIQIDGEPYNFDIMIGLDGELKKREKKLSREALGTGHMLSLPEAKVTYEEGAEKIIIGTGLKGMLILPDETYAFFKEKNCEVVTALSPEAINIYNETEGKIIGLFHVTC